MQKENHLKKERPLVSIIMPAYNAEKYINAAIESVTNQTYTNWELLIADDGSSDNSKAIIGNCAIKESRIKLFPNKENLGYLKTCNKLFQLVNGEYITFQDADDWSDKDRIRKQVEVFNSNPALGICGTWARYFDEDGKAFKEKKPTLEHREIKKKILSQSQFCGASIMVKREVLETVGYYKEFFDRIGNEDYDWSLRVVEKYPAANIPEFLYNVRIARGSVSKKLGNHRKFFSDKIAIFLATERYNYGTDSLDRKTNYQTSPLSRYVDELDKPFLMDSSKKYREAAFINFHSGLLSQSLMYSGLAIKDKPLMLLNWKVFLRLFIKKLIGI